MAQQQHSEWYLSPKQIRAMSEAQLRDALAKQQEWAQQRFPNDAYKAGQPEAKPQGSVSFTNVRDPLVVKLREFAGWSPEHLQKVHPNDLARLVHSNGQVINAITLFDSQKKTAAPTAPAAKEEQPEFGKVDGAGGQMSPETLAAVKKKNEEMGPAAKEEPPELGKVDTAGGQMTPAMLEAVKKENEKMEAAVKAEKEKAASAKPSDTAAAPGAMTPKETEKTKADFAAEAKAAEISKTQALLHMFGAYDASDGSKAATIDGKAGYATRRALDNFAERVQRADPSLHFNSYEEIADQLRIEALANRETWQGTAENMRTSTDPFTRSVGEQVSAFLAHPENVPADRRPVLGSGITRMVERYQQPAPVETAATPAATAPGQESTFEEPAFGFNDRGPVLRPSQAAFPLAAQGQTPEPASRNRTQRTESDLGQRAYDVVDALMNAQRVTDEKTQKFFAQAYNRNVDQGLIRNGDPVLFEGDPDGRLFVAVGQEDRNKVGIVEVAPDSKVVSDMKALAAANKGVYIDQDTIKSTQKQRPVNATEDRRAANVIEALQRDPDDITKTNLGQILERSYRNDIAENRIRPGEPVLFEGDRKGRLFVAYGGQDGGNVIVKDITNFNDPKLGTNPLARDIASLATEGRGGMVDNTTVPNAYAAAMDRARQWQEQREQQRQQQLAQQQEWSRQREYSSASQSGWGQRGGYEGVDRGPPPGWRGGNPGVSFRGDRGPPPGWPGGDNPGISFWSQNHHGRHHHGHEERRFSLDNPGGLLRSIFGGASAGQSGQPGDSGPVGVIADLLDNTSARWTTGHGHNRFNLN